MASLPGSKARAPGSRGKGRLGQGPPLAMGRAPRALERGAARRGAAPACRSAGPGCSRLPARRWQAGAGLVPAARPREPPRARPAVVRAAARAPAGRPLTPAVLGARRRGPALERGRGSTAAAARRAALALRGGRRGGGSGRRGPGPPSGPAARGGRPLRPARGGGGPRCGAAGARWGPQAAGLAAPFALKRAVDALSRGPGAGGCAAGVKWIVTFALLKGSSQQLNSSKNVLLSLISRPMGRRLSMRLYAHLLELDLQFHTSRRTGELLRRLDRCSRAVETILRAALFTFVPVCCELCVVVGLLSSRGRDVAAIVLSAFVSYVAFTIAMTLGWVTRARRRMNRFDDAQSARSTEGLINIEQVKLFRALDREGQRYDSALRGYQGAAQSSDFAGAALVAGQQVITTSGLGLALWSVARRVGSGAASVGDIPMVHGLVLQLWNPLQFLGVYVREARQAVIDLEDASALLALEPLVTEPSRPAPLPAAGPEVPVVEFRSVHFRYGDAGPAVLRGVSLAVPAGSCVALVGASGSGKSTLGRLVPRLADPCGGAVFFNGVDVRQLEVAELRGRIAVVSQDVVVFNETMRYNLAYAKPDASQAELALALEASGLSSAVAALPAGLETAGGERGLALSGGERQRLALARALLQPAELVLLDEATSALDAAAEAAVLRALLAERGRGRSLLAITHRLDTARLADEVVVLDRGEVVERGDPWWLPTGNAGSQHGVLLDHDSGLNITGSTDVTGPSDSNFGDKADCPSPGGTPARLRPIRPASGARRGGGYSIGGTLNPNAAATLSGRLNQ
ncbi:unnamed protein product [Prorocentrum cordatum]|uniref:ATP-dependent transporter ycf16 n=1 Tax=Prorocentrum cordatum TaxID=2364126 RepID=A0ABN9U053_9DINO|nr:unnamed protein product [Polarella glacialis]